MPSECVHPYASTHAVNSIGIITQRRVGFTCVSDICQPEAWASGCFSRRCKTDLSCEIERLACLKKSPFASCCSLAGRAVLELDLCDNGRACRWVHCQDGSVASQLGQGVPSPYGWARIFACPAVSIEME